MKFFARGKNINFREVTVSDAAFILKLRTDPEKNKHLSETPNDIQKQINFIENYFNNSTDYYFIISNMENNPVGTVRIYDIQGDSFCWGSWILADNAPKYAAIESALLIYNFGFYALNYAKSHFDVRKTNQKVIDFHLRFGATIVSEDALNFYFEYAKEAYISVQKTYNRFLP